MSEAPVQEGEILAGKYRVERVLGVGGMGVVVAATHIQLDERVAIKFLLKEALASGEAVARFAREARAAVKIKSEHVARVIDVGTLETGAPYMVMEYLEGGDLSQVLAQPRPAPGRGSGRLRPAGVRGHRRGARARHRPPRSEAGQPLPHSPTRRHQRHQGARFRHLQGDARQERVVRQRHDAHPNRHGLAALHVARADGVHARRRRSHRYLGARRHPLRARGGAAALQRRDDASALRAHFERRHAFAPQHPTAGASRARHGAATLSRKGSQAPPREHRRVRGCDRRIRTQARARIGRPHLADHPSGEHVGQRRGDRGLARGRGSDRRLVGRDCDGHNGVEVLAQSGMGGRSRHGDSGCRWLRVRSPQRGCGRDGHHGLGATNSGRGADRRSCASDSAACDRDRGRSRRPARWSARAQPSPSWRLPPRPGAKRPPPVAAHPPGPPSPAAPPPPPKPAAPAADLFDDRK